MLGDFNIKCKNWYKTTTEGTKIESVTSQFGLHQIINEPTHVLENSSSSIDLIFTLQQNLVVDSGAHRYLHPYCHHQIVHAKFNLKIHFRPPYQREIWHYRQGNTELVRIAVHEFNWMRAFSNLNINERVSFFNRIFFFLHIQFTPSQTKNSQSPGTHTSGRTRDPSQRATKK